MSVAAVPVEAIQDAGSATGRRRAPGVVMLIAAAVVAMSGGSMLAGEVRLDALFPVQTVRFDGELAHVARADLREAVSAVLSGGLFSADLGAIRAQVTALPWVAGATVRRVWPDALRITVEEHSAVAAWGKTGLVTPQGEVFRPAQRPIREPRLAGPEGSAEAVLSRYQSLRERLAPLQLKLVGLRLNGRRAWRASLASGATLILGRQDLEARLGRFTGAWAKVRAGGVSRAAETIDLRYPNGLAVRWRRVAAAGEKETQE